MESHKAQKIITILSILLAISIVLSFVLTILLINCTSKTMTDKRWKSAAISPEKVSDDGIYIDKYMQEAIYNAINNEGIGGPVGAVITKINGELVVSTSNHNVSTGNTLMHGEMYALNEAQAILGTKDLSDCVLYTSAEPCLMCAAAIAHAKISKVYYAASFEDSAPYGFNDEAYYDRLIKGDTLTEWVYVDQPNKTEPFEGWYQRKRNKSK